MGRLQAVIRKRLAQALWVLAESVLIGLKPVYLVTEVASLLQPALRGDLLELAPLPGAAVHYTRKLDEFVAWWSRVMTIEDVADLAGLELGCGQADRQATAPVLPLWADWIWYRVKHLSIDEIYVGKKRATTRWFWIWLAGGFWASPGRGKGRFTGLLAAFAPESGAHWRGGHGHERSLLRMAVLGRTARRAGLFSTAIM